MTGSASFYLKNLFSESLAGRKYIFELFPLSFQEFLKFWVLVELLIQQFTAPSAIREEVDQDQFAFILRLGNGIIQGALEPILSNNEGREEQEEKR